MAAHDVGRSVAIIPIIWKAVLLSSQPSCAGTTIFSKAVVVPGQAVQPECKIPPFAEYGGIKIPAPCLFSGLWP